MAQPKSDEGSSPLETGVTTDTQAPEEVTPPTDEEVMSELSPSQRREFIGGKPLREILAIEGLEDPEADKETGEESTEVPAEEPKATEEKDPQEAAAEQEVKSDPKPEIEVEPEEEPEKKDPSRFRFKEDEDRTIAMLAKTKGISLRAAAKLFEGTPEAAQADASPVEPVIPPEIAEIDTQEATIAETIKKLTEERAAAVEEIDTVAMLDISDKLTEAKMSLLKLGTRKESLIREADARADADYRTQAMVSRDAAYADYPKLSDPKSMERMAFDNFWQSAQRDPKRAAEFNSPEWPQRLAVEFAEQVGLTPKSETKSDPEPSPKETTTPKPKLPAAKPAVKQVPGARLLNGADGETPSTSSPTLTPEAAIAGLAQMTRAERRKLAALYK